jgi:hypothetical protein
MYCVHGKRIIRTLPPPRPRTDPRLDVDLVENRSSRGKNASPTISGRARHRRRPRSVGRYLHINQIEKHEKKTSVMIMTVLPLYLHIKYKYNKIRLYTFNAQSDPSIRYTPSTSNMFRTCTINTDFTYLRRCRFRDGGRWSLGRPCLVSILEWGWGECRSPHCHPPDDRRC